MTKSLRFFLSGFMFSFIAFALINVFQAKFDSYLTAEISQPLDNIASVVFEKKMSPPPEINADAAISLEIKPDGFKKNILLKNAGDPLPIASLTKLMTALIVLENPKIFDLSQTVIVSKKAADQGDSPNYGSLKAGEKYSLEKLLEFTIIYSSNDAAFSIAEIAGVENFIGLMNQKAARLGMNYTYFLNPSGLDQKTENPDLRDLNYSTAEDLAKLAGYIIENHPLISELSLEAYKQDFIENGLSGVKLDYGQIFIAGKTGFTKNAKGCLLFVFKNKKGSTFINVILGAADEKERIAEMQKIVNWISFQ